MKIKKKTLNSCIISQFQLIIDTNLSSIRHIVTHFLGLANCPYEKSIQNGQQNKWQQNSKKC